MEIAPEIKVFSPNKTLNLKGKLIDVSKPAVMGILNITPDSFYDGGRFTSDSNFLDQTERMLKEGAVFIDVGGYSSRPGAKEITIREEMNRVIPAIRSIVKAFPEAILSIDTFRSDVAEASVAEGACMINDISGGSLDEKMFETVARLKVPYVLMHMRGNPATMNSESQYENLLKEITTYFHSRIDKLHIAGVKDVIIDPGFGFAKTVQHNFQLMQRLEYLKILEKPLMVGLSRKSMVWRTLGIDAEHALNGTTVLNTIAVLKGANILRVHDVKQAVEVVKLTAELQK
jgi:dihydropteroate synthase